MPAIQALVSFAVMILSTASALPTEQLQERGSGVCPAGNFRMKLYYQNANGQMAWNGKYVSDLGGPLGSTDNVARASAYNVLNGNGNLIEYGSTQSNSACINPQPYSGQPQNTTVVVYNNLCQNPYYVPVKCTQTPQYNLCSAGPNNYVQQCGQFLVYVPQKRDSIDGAACGPLLSFFIDKC